MSLRLTLYALAADHGLGAEDSQRLQALARGAVEPAGISRAMVRGLAVAAAALGGLGLILWIAANWADWGRMGRFAILQSWVLVAALAAWARPSLRAPMGLVALLGTGALFAYFGQTYQTGADPWQLFAVWALLTLPWCLGARSDVLWAPWAVVVMTAVALWLDAHVRHRWWGPEQRDLSYHLLAWAVAAAVLAGLSQRWVRVTGAGLWSLRTAATLLVCLVGSVSLSALFHREVGAQYVLGILVLAALAAWLALSCDFDVYALSAVVLALDTLLVCGLGRLLFEHGGGDWIGRMFMLGLAAAGLLAASVSGVMRVARGRAAVLAGASGDDKGARA